MTGLRLRREGLFSAVGLHLVAFSILAIATIGLGVRLVLDWRATSTSNVDAMASRQAELRTLQIQTAPLRGLDKKVEASRKEIDAFYAKRIPPSYSAILEAIGDLQTKSAVRYTRGQYTQAPGSGDLTEIRIDAGLSGDYSGIMRFINGLERNQNFFIVRAMALTGQQSGTVNLRLQVSTWLRPEDAAASGLPIAGSETAKPDADTSPSGEGQ